MPRQGAYFSLSTKQTNTASNCKSRKSNITLVLTVNLSPDAVGGKHGSCRIRRFTTQKEHTSVDVCSFCLGCSNYLSSRVVSNKVLSAQVSLTSVFGMRTGGPHRYRHRNGIYSRLPLYISVFFESADSQPHSINLIFVPFKPKAH